MLEKPVIAQLLPALHHGGVERGTIEVANHLAQKGWQSLVISSGGRLVAELDPLVEHIELDLGKKSLLTLFKVKKLRRLIFDKKINIIHARSRLPAWIAYKAIKGIKQNPPKFVTTVHGLYSVKRYSSIMSRGDRVIAVSNTAKQYIEKHYSHHLSCKIDLIYRGIDPTDFIYKNNNDSFRKLFFKDFPELKGHKCVLLPGRLSQLKGLEELDLWLQETGAKLLLTTNPDSNSDSIKAKKWILDNGFENKVCWIGFQSQIAKLYSLVDLVIAPSTRPESFGRTVAEALATGTPVVGYAHGGVKEILEEIYPTGLVKPFNKTALKETIESHIKSPQTVPDRQPFLLKNMLEQTFQLYKECLHGF